MYIPDNLWQHQKDVISTAVNKGRYALFWEPGTGKTLTMITIFRNLYARAGKPLKTLIVSPLVTLKNWEDEINKYSNCGQYVQILSGKTEKRIKLLQQDDKKIFITNYESLYLKNLFLREDKSFINHNFDLVIFDEAHRTKNHQSKTSRIALKIASNAKYRYILTGTPILNSYMDIWPQIHILDDGNSLAKNFYIFRATYFIDKNIKMPSQKHFPDFKPRMGAEEHIKKVMEEKGSFVRKDECLSLPPFVEQQYKVGMSPEQEKHYNAILKDFISFVTDTKSKEIKASTAQIALTKVLRLMQISSGFMTLDDGEKRQETHSFKDNPKLEALKELVYDIPGKKIVWCVFKENYKAIGDMLTKEGITYTYLIGGMNEKEREESLRKFKEGDTDILIASPAAAGIGINIIEAKTAIWYSRTYSYEQREQAKARNYRGGSEIHDKILSIDLISSDIEGKVIEALKHKQQISDFVKGIV